MAFRLKSVHGITNCYLSLAVSHDTSLCCLAEQGEESSLCNVSFWAFDILLSDASLHFNQAIFMVALDNCLPRSLTPAQQCSSGDRPCQTLFPDPDTMVLRPSSLLLCSKVATSWTGKLD